MTQAKGSRSTDSKPYADGAIAARPSPSSKEGDGTASVPIPEDATLTDGLGQEPSQLDRIEAMLAWLCEAIAGEQDDEEEAPIATSLDAPATRQAERRATL